MTHRLAPALTLAFLLSMPAAALAGTGGSGGATASSSSGSGGTASNGSSGSSGVDPTCNVAQQQQSGETCQECSGSDMNACQGELGANYSFACSTVDSSGNAFQIWCNGPSGTSYQSPGCSLGGAEPSPARVAGGLGAALVALAAWAARRRR